MDGKISISPQELYAAIGTASAPTVIDARRTAAFDADDKYQRGIYHPKISGIGDVSCGWAPQLSSTAFMATE